MTKHQQFREGRRFLALRWITVFYCSPVHHCEGVEAGARLAGHIAFAVKKQRKNRKWELNCKPWRPAHRNTLPSARPHLLKSLSVFPKQCQLGNWMYKHKNLFHLQSTTGTRNWEPSSGKQVHWSWTNFAKSQPSSQSAGVAEEGRLHCSGGMESTAGSEGHVTATSSPEKPAHKLFQYP